MKNCKKRLNDKANIIATIILVAFCISIIPVLYAGLFTHPVADDYSFSYRVHDAIQNRSSVIAAVIDTVVNTYNNWQGTFSATALFSLQPGVFSPSCYFLTSFIMVGALIGSTFFLFTTIVKRMLCGKNSHVIIISCLTLLMSIQFVPNANQAFYWFNGSAYYTLFYSLALVFFTLLLRLRTVELKRKRIANLVLILILAVIIGGGNYTTALIMAELTALVTIIEFYQRSPKKWLFAVILVTYLIAFSANAIAPGNSVRATAVTGLNPVKAILLSFYYAAVSICNWTAVPQFVYVAAIAILSVFLIPKCSIKFNYPLLNLGIAFSLFASQMTPPLYAMSNIGDGRQIDIYYYSYYLLMAFSVFYICGWAYRRLVQDNKNEGALKRLRIGSLIDRHIWTISIILCIIWGAGCLSSGLLRMTSAQTAKAIVDGSLIQYDQEYRAVFEKLDTGTGDIEITDIKTVPPFLSDLDLSVDSEYWTNKALAQYFGVDSVTALSGELNERRE